MFAYGDGDDDFMQDVSWRQQHQSMSCPEHSTGGDACDRGASATQ